MKTFYGGRLFYRLLFFMSFIVIFSSFTHAAVIFGDRVFHGDVFNSNLGDSFKIYGLDAYNYYNNDTGITEIRYRKVFITSSIDEAVTILDAECVSTHKYKYCYKGSSYNFDNPRTYEGPETLPSMLITIESLPSPSSLIVINRNATISHYCGKIVTIPINITNAGTMPSEVTYTERLPINTFVSSVDGGSVDENVVTFKDHILANTTKYYSYTLVNLDCKNKTWSASYTFTTFNSSLSKNLTNLNLLVLSAYTINDSISRSKTNLLTDDIIYTWNINNTHDSLSIRINSTLYISGYSGLFITEASPGVVRSGELYTYSELLGAGSSSSVYIKFRAINYGNYTILNKGTIGVNDRYFDYNTSRSVLYAAPIVYAYMEINATNTSLNVRVLARNDDVTEKYYYLYGILKGVSDEEPMYVNSAAPDTAVLVGTRFYNTTGLGLQNVTVIFDGIYRDKNSVEHKLHAEQPIILNSPKIISTDPTIIKTVINATNNFTEVPITTPAVNTTQKSNNTNTPTAEPKKDFITRMIEGLNKFLQSIFGK